MRVELRIVVVEANPNSTPKKGRPPKGKEVIKYAPAILDAARIDFAYVDDDDDINVHYAGTDDFYTIKNTEGMLSKIDAIIEKQFPEIKGLRSK